MFPDVSIGFYVVLNKGDSSEGEGGEEVFDFWNKGAHPRRFCKPPNIQATLSNTPNNQLRIRNAQIENIFLRS